MSDKLQVTAKDFDNLQKLYKQAVKDGKDSFTFMSKPILTSYAKYLIEYLKTVFK